MGERGFWDEQQRVAKLQDKMPVLKRIDPLILFKMLILQQLFNLSDEELEFQVNDRRAFEEFVGLGVMNYIPNAITLAFFREWLRRAKGQKERHQLLRIQDQCLH